MSRNICLIAFGTFGNPNGFKQTFFIGGDIELAKSIKTFDLKTDAIRLFPGSKVYSVRRDSVNGSKAISYGLYTYAKEQKSDRGGTFIGSAVLYLDAIAEESSTIRCLNEFHDSLVRKNVQNDTITVNHSDEFAVSKPQSYEALTAGRRDIEEADSAQAPNKSLVVYSEVSAAKLQVLFKKALDLLNVYDTIYFTSTSEVAEFVHQKNLFQLVQADGMEKELLKLQDERKQYLQALIAEYESETGKLQEDKKRVLGEWSEQISANEKLHQKNKKRIEDWKQAHSHLTQTYDGYEKRIQHTIAQLTAGKKPAHVRQLHNENKRIFIDAVNGQKQPVFINDFPQPLQAKTNLKPGVPQTQYVPPVSVPNAGRSREKSRRLSTFKIASFVLLLLWLGTLSYFLFFAPAESPVADVPAPIIKPHVDTPAAPQPLITQLNPKPNDKLGAAALQSVIKKLKPGASVDEVTSIIFTNNPETIRKIYLYQKEDYKKYLVEQNAGYFERKDSSVYLVKDTLAVIPGYK